MRDLSPAQISQILFGSLHVSNTRKTSTYELRKKKCRKCLVRRVLSIKGFKIFVLDVKVEKEFVRAFYRRLGFKEVRLIIMRVVRASTNNTILEMG